MSTQRNPITGTVATTATQILRANPRRVGFSIINSSINTILVAPYPAVTTSAGITLNPQGSCLTVTADHDEELARLPWWAIAVGAAASVDIYEHEEP